MSVHWLNSSASLGFVMLPGRVSLREENDKRDDRSLVDRSKVMERVVENARAAFPTIARPR